MARMAMGAWEPLEIYDEPTGTDSHGRRKTKAAGDDPTFVRAGRGAFARMTSEQLLRAGLDAEEEHVRLTTLDSADVTVGRLVRHVRLDAYYVVTSRERAGMTRREMTATLRRSPQSD